MICTKSSSGITFLLAVFLAAAGALSGADGPGTDDIRLLKEQLSAQQKQREGLQKTIAEEQRFLERATESRPVAPEQPEHSSVHVRFQRKPLEGCQVRRVDVHGPV